MTGGYFGGAGPAIGGDKTYLHVQDVARSEWNCPHGLGKIASPVLRDTLGNEIGGDVRHADDGMSSTVVFLIPVAGTASFN